MFRGSRRIFRNISSSSNFAGGVASRPRQVRANKPTRFGGSNLFQLSYGLANTTLFASSHATPVKARDYVVQLVRVSIRNRAQKVCVRAKRFDRKSQRLKSSSLTRNSFVSRSFVTSSWRRQCAKKLFVARHAMRKRGLRAIDASRLVDGAARSIERVLRLGTFLCEANREPEEKSKRQPATVDFQPSVGSAALQWRAFKLLMIVAGWSACRNKPLESPGRAAALALPSFLFLFFFFFFFFSLPSLPLSSRLSFVPPCFPKRSNLFSPFQSPFSTSTFSFLINYSWLVSRVRLHAQVAGTLHSRPAIFPTPFFEALRSSLSSISMDGSPR